MHKLRLCILKLQISGTNLTNFTLTEKPRERLIKKTMEAQMFLNTFAAAFSPLIFLGSGMDTN